MPNAIVKLLPLPNQGSNPPANKWIGRIVVFELSTGTRVSGKILAISEDWIDTDNGAIRVEHIVHAKWVSPEEASITRGGPLNSYNYRLR